MSDHPLDRLFATIAARKAAGDAAASYTAKLLAAGVARCAKKFGEESVEAVIAAMEKDKTALAAESADVLYHLLVLLEASGVSLDEVIAELERRMAEDGWVRPQLLKFMRTEYVPGMKDFDAEGNSKTSS